MVRGEERKLSALFTNSRQAGAGHGANPGRGGLARGRRDGEFGLSPRFPVAVLDHQSDRRRADLLWLHQTTSARTTGRGSRPASDFIRFSIMFGALWAGAYVLSFFGVSLDALRIAGGTVIALSGWQLLTSSEPHPDRRSRERADRRGRRQRSDATGVLSPDAALHHRAGHDRGRDYARRRAAADTASAFAVLRRRRASPLSPTRRSSGSPIASPIA